MLETWFSEILGETVKTVPHSMVEARWKTL
jgi:hypothetical protein